MRIRRTTRSSSTHVVSQRSRESSQSPLRDGGLSFFRKALTGAAAGASSRTEDRSRTTGELREFDLVESDYLKDLLGRLVIGWKAGRVWRVHGATAATYPVLEIADAQPPRFPGFDKLIVSYERLQAVVKQPRYAAWQTALSSIVGIYLITDTRDGRHYVGKADGTENILQRWRTYATNGHGGNVALRERDPSTFQYSLLRVFDPSTPLRDVNAAESHFKRALDSITHGLNRG